MPDYWNVLDSLHQRPAAAPLLPCPSWKPRQAICRPIFPPTSYQSQTARLRLSPRLVQKNQFPAVDLGISVSRVGGKAQSRTLRAIAGNLRVTLSQFEELEEFARFGTRLDTATRERLARGTAVRAALRQPERHPQPADEQLVVLVCAMQGLLDSLDEPACDDAMQTIGSSVEEHMSWVKTLIAEGATLSDEVIDKIVAAGRASLNRKNQADASLT